MIQSGDKFGRLTAVRFADRDSHGHTRWLFKCECGNDHVSLVNTIKRGNSKSCGCFRNSTGIPTIAEGRKFNRWTAIRPVGQRGTNNFWIFRCDCGTEREVNTTSVRHAWSKSCGCLRKPTEDEKRIDRIFKTIKRGSVKRKLPFILLKSDIAKLAERQSWKCAQTGISLDFTIGNGRRPFGPTIDRIDNARGYEPGNIQLVCNLYNYCKNEHTPDDVFMFAEALVKHNQSLAVNKLKLRIVS